MRFATAAANGVLTAGITLSNGAGAALTSPDFGFYALGYSAPNQYVSTTNGCPSNAPGVAACVSATDGTNQVSIGGSNSLGATTLGALAQPIATPAGPGYGEAVVGIGNALRLIGTPNTSGLITIASNISGTFVLGRAGLDNQIVAYLGQQSTPGSAAPLPGYSVFTFNQYPALVVPQGGEVQQCIACTVNGQAFAPNTIVRYSMPSIFDITLTAQLPYMLDAAGKGTLDWVASLQLLAGNGTVNALDPTTFSITLPLGVTYSSALSFAAPVPEPETYALVLTGLGFVGFVAWRRRA